MVPQSERIVASLLRKGEEVCFTVTSASMRPVFSPGDKIGVKRKARPYGFGDIVLYRDREGYCVHRIIGKKDGRFLTKGDRRRVSDPPLEKEAVFGHAVWVKKKKGSSPRLISRFSLDGLFGRCVNTTLGVFSLAELVLWEILSRCIPHPFGEGARAPCRESASGGKWR